MEMKALPWEVSHETTRFQTSCTAVIVKQTFRSCSYPVTTKTNTQVCLCFCYHRHSDLSQFDFCFVYNKQFAFPFAFRGFNLHNWRSGYVCQCRQHGEPELCRVAHSDPSFNGQMDSQRRGNFVQRTPQWSLGKTCMTDGVRKITP